MQIQNEIKRISRKYSTPEAKAAINELSGVFAEFLNDFVAQAKEKAEPEQEATSCA